MDDELRELLAKAKARVDAMTPEEYAEMIRQQREAWVRAEMAWDEEGTTTIILGNA